MKLFDSFKCKINPDIENFLKNNAIDFEKKYISRTFLIIDEKKKKVAAYYTAALKYFQLYEQNLSITKFKKLFGRKEKVKDVVTYLIAQLGRSDDYSTDDINGTQLIDYALATIKIAQTNVGGKHVLLECDDNSKIKALYEANGFVYLQKNYKNNLIQMIRILKKD